MLKVIEKEAEKVNTVCKNSGMEHGIHALGWVDDMAEEYQTNQIFIGVSRAALEAASCGCAVVLCGNEGRGGILSPDNPAGRVTNFCCRGEPFPDEGWLFQSICNLLRDKSLEETATITSAWVREQYSSARMAEETEKIYLQWE